MSRNVKGAIFKDHFMNMRYPIFEQMDAALIYYIRQQIPMNFSVAVDITNKIKEDNIL